MKILQLAVGIIMIVSGSCSVDDLGDNSSLSGYNCDRSNVTLCKMKKQMPIEFAMLGTFSLNTTRTCYVSRHIDCGEPGGCDSLTLIDVGTFQNVAVTLDTLSFNDSLSDNGGQALFKVDYDLQVRPEKYSAGHRTGTIVYKFKEGGQLDHLFIPEITEFEAFNRDGGMWDPNHDLDSAIRKEFERCQFSSVRGKGIKRYFNSGPTESRVKSTIEGEIQKRLRYAHKKAACIVSKLNPNATQVTDDENNAARSQCDASLESYETSINSYRLPPPSGGGGSTDSGTSDGGNSDGGNSDGGPIGGDYGCGSGLQCL